MLLIIFQAPFEQTGMGFDPMADYKAVWIDEGEGLTIDEVWTMFQRVEEGVQMPPEGYTGRSLSIGDVVRLGDDFFTPEPIGWRKLNETEGKAVSRLTNVQVKAYFKRMWENR